MFPACTGNARGKHVSIWAKKLEKLRFQSQGIYLNTVFQESKEMCTAIPSFLQRNSTENLVASFNIDFSTWNKLETL